MQDLTYTLSGTDATSFAIVADSGQLQTRAALDYETKTDYEVTVTANDGTLSSDPITVTIVVDDVTDGDTAVVNSVPFFNDGPRTTREVNENAAEMDIRINADSPNSSGDPVAATDYTPGTETPSGDTLTYGLRGTDAALFDIDNTSGQLKTKAELDHETKSSYMVVVTVTDGRDAENNVDATVDDTIMVTIEVVDVNEAPEFAAKTATREVAEDTGRDADIGAPVVAMDVDSGDTLTYTLGGADARLFRIVTTDTGQLKTLATDAYNALIPVEQTRYLNYEYQTDYEVTVTAMDDDDTPLSSDPITVTINVTDVSVAAGDTPVVNSEPFFNDGLHATRSVKENTEADANIGAPVAATDVDSGDTLTYAFDETANNDHDSFAIVRTTGQLQTPEPLDYETKTDYEVTVTVTDGKDDTNNADAAVDDIITVTIRVANEVEDDYFLNSPPRFLMESIDLEVLENTAEDTNIGEPILAFDADTADSLTYGFDGDDAAKFTVDEGSNTALFTFNSETGQLKTNRAIPSYEVAPGYMVMLTVKDSKDEDGESDADEEADSSIPITITVTDTSDRPAFASDETGERSVAENTAAGEDIGDPFTATDADTDAVVTYTPSVVPMPRRLTLMRIPAS